MEEKNKSEIINSRPEKVDFYIYDEAMARAERHSRRWMIACVVAFAAFIISNCLWMWYESQFEDVTTTVTQETTTEGGGDAIIHGDHAGAVINGKSKTDSDN